MRISDPEILLSESSIISYPTSINSPKGDIGEEAQFQAPEILPEASMYLVLSIMCVQIWRWVVVPSERSTDSDGSSSPSESQSEAAAHNEGRDFDDDEQQQARMIYSHQKCV